MNENTSGIIGVKYSSPNHWVNKRKNISYDITSNESIAKGFNTFFKGNLIFISFP